MSLLVDCGVKFLLAPGLLFYAEGGFHVCLAMFGALRVGVSTGGVVDGAKILRFLDGLALDPGGNEEEPEAA